jgi:copper transport protein
LPVPGRSLRAPRFLLLAGVLLLLSAGVPAVALAHANLDRAEPTPGSALDQAPPQLKLFFSEAVDPSFSRVQLLDDKRDQVDKGDSRVAPDDPRAMLVSLPSGLPNGVYTVSWRTLSAVDGHTVNGAYPLIIGPMPAEGVAPATASASSQASFTPETAVGRWWFTLAASVLFGALVTWRVVFRPLFGRANPAALPLAAIRSRRLAVLAAVVLLVGTLYGALAQAASAADAPLWAAFGRPLVDLLSRGRFAAFWWSRLGLVVLTLGIVYWRGVRGRPGDIALAATAAALLTSSLNSHGAALLSGAYLGVAVDWLHFLAVSTWLGGLASLIYVLPTIVQASAATGERVLAQAVNRFSNLALAAVGVIVLTGTFQAWLEVGSWEGLIQTTYGLSITTKIGLLTVMLLLGAFNLLIIRPRLEWLAGRGSNALATLTRHLTRAVRAEMALGVLVLVVTAVLTGVTPAREELARRADSDLQGGPVDRQVTAQGLNMRVQITPNALGINRFAVQVPGVDPNQVERVQLTLTYLDAELGSQPLVLPAGSSPGTWETTSPLLSQAGTWQADLLVRRTNEDDARSSLRFLVAAPGGAPAQPATATGVYPLLPSPQVSAAYALIAAGLGVAVFGALRARRTRRRVRLQQQGALLAAGVLVMACGGYVYTQEQRTGVPLDVANIRDPVPADERSLNSGRDIYTTHCEACHGETGRGDGPEGLRLVPRPADLRIHMAPGVHTDGELFYWISYGFQGSAMPAWKDTLTEEQRWDVMNYARTLSDQSTRAAAPAN